MNPDTGDDTNSGISEDQAFKTLPYALNYTSGRYNLSNYNCYIHLAAGTYSTSDESGWLDLANFNTIASTIYIIGNSPNTTILNYAVRLRLQCTYQLQNLTIKPIINTPATLSAQYSSVLVSNGGTITLSNCKIDLSEANFGSNYSNCALNCEASYLNINNGCTIDFGSNYPNTLLNVFNCYKNCNVYIQDDLNLYGQNTNSSSSFISGQQFCSINFNTCNSVINTDTDFQFSGRKYYIANYGIIKVPSGDTNFLPGDIAGIAVNSIYN